MSHVMQLEETLVLTQRKLDQKNHDNEVLQDNLKQALLRKTCSSSHVVCVSQWSCVYAHAPCVRACTHPRATHTTPPIHMHMDVHTHTLMHMHSHGFVCVCVCMWLCMVHVCMYIHVHMHARVLAREKLKERGGGVDWILFASKILCYAYLAKQIIFWAYRKEGGLKKSRVTPPCFPALAKTLHACVCTHDWCVYAHAHVCTCVHLCAYVYTHSTHTNPCTNTVESGL